MALQKGDALEYLDRQAKPVTAKELAIDLDSRASTASELLERMTAQGLVKRDPNQRPREYALTDAGRKRLEFFRSRAADGNATAKGADQGSLPVAPSNGDGPAPSVTVDSARLEKLEAMQRDFADRLSSFEDRLSSLEIDFEKSLAQFLAPKGAKGESSAERASRVENLLRRADALAARQRQPADQHVAELYKARHALESLPFFSFGRRGPAEDRVAQVEAKLERSTAQAVERLVELEAGSSSPSESERGEIARLREELRLSPDLKPETESVEVQG
jgi:DNA-binding MarR family transcriptional regulator